MRSSKRNQYISSNRLVEFSRVDGVSAAVAIAFDVACISSAIALAIWAQAWWSTLFAIVVVAARQHALLVLMHEAAHKGLFANKRLNEWVGEAVLAWPFFIEMHRYREKHMAHHRHLNTAEDPDWAFTHDPDGEAADWQFPMSRWRLARLLLSDLLGFGTLNLLGKMRRYSGVRSSSSKGRPVGRLARWRVAFYVTLAGLLTISGGWISFAVYWVLPMLTVLKALLRLRLMAEHYGMGRGDDTRTVSTNGFGRFFLSPHHINFHVEHHHYPAVRFSQLPALHRQLVSAGAYDTDLHRTPGYLSVLRECSSAATADS